MTSKAAIYQQTGLFFTLTVDTTDQSRVGASNTDQYSLPLQDVSGIYSAIVVYNDEVIHTINSSSDNLITFPDGGGIKTFEIRGRLKGIQHANGGADNPKLLELKWGQCEFANFNNLRDCPNLSKVSGGNFSSSKLRIGNNLLKHFIAASLHKYSKSAPTYP